MKPLCAKASAARASSLDRYDRNATRVPIVVQAPLDAAEARLAPEELFLMNLLEGNADLRSLRRLASLRETEVLETLERMIDKGLIQLGDPELPSPARSA